jgi:hypothetical protein
VTQDDTNFTQKIRNQALRTAILCNRLSILENANTAVLAVLVSSLSSSRILDGKIIFVQIQLDVILNTPKSRPSHRLRYLALPHPHPDARTISRGAKHSSGGYFPRTEA